MSAFTILMLVLSAITGLGAWLYLRYVEKKESGGEAPSLPRRAEKGKAVNLKDLWEVEDVRQGVLVLPYGRYRVICRVSAADFWLLSEEEQNDGEDAAAAALMQLTFPVQVLVTSQAVDVKAAVEELRTAVLPPALKDLADQRAAFLEAMAQERGAVARQAYLVVPYDTVKGFEHARGELAARVALLADALAAAKVRVEMLSSDAVVDLLAHLLNRGRPWRPSEAVEAGAMALFHVSERSVAHV
ncbi:MAG: hypothetical protein XD69_1111 [Clostridia bacterium 62_21]|nr:MAG: hypothetical protein XD69_1111 [Clostridia bacterium 62_21]